MVVRHVDKLEIKAPKIKSLSGVYTSMEKIFKFSFNALKHDLLKVMFAFVTLLAMAVLAFGFFTASPPRAIMAALEERSGRQIAGIHYTDWKDGRRYLVVSADELVIEEQVYLAFKIRSIQQAVLKNAIFQLFFDSGPKPAGDSFSFADTLRGLRPAAMPTRQGSDTTTNKITKIRMVPFLLTVHDHEKATFRLQAQLGEWQVGKKQSRFTNVVLDDLVNNKKIYTATAFWDEDRHRFLIPGSYRAVTSKGQAYSQGLQVGLDFSLATLP